MSEVKKFTINSTDIDVKINSNMLDKSVVDLINSSGGGTITNYPDEEDLTSMTNENGITIIRQKNRNSGNGKGYVILRKNKSIISQLNKPNTIYEVRYDFDLDGDTINIPVGCTLDFQGGDFLNGTLNCNQTYILNRYSNLSCKLKGSFDAPFRRCPVTSKDYVVLPELLEGEYLTQEMMNNTNTIYEIRYDYDLNGKCLYLKTDSELVGNGGSLKNGRIRCVKDNVVSGNIPTTKCEIFGYFTKSNYSENLGYTTQYNKQEIVKLADSYTSRRHLFRYGRNYTCFAKECMPEDDRWYINCSNFVSLFILGIPFENSKYAGNSENTSNGNAYIHCKEYYDYIVNNGGSSIYAPIASRRMAFYFDQKGYGFMDSIENCQLGDILFSDEAGDEENSTANYWDEYYGINHVSVFAYRIDDRYYRWEVGNDNGPVLSSYAINGSKSKIKRMARIPRYQDTPEQLCNISRTSYRHQYDLVGNPHIYISPLKPLKALNLYTLVVKANIIGSDAYFIAKSANGDRLSLYYNNKNKIGDYYYFILYPKVDYDNFYIVIANREDGDKIDCIETFLYKGVVDSTNFVKEPYEYGSLTQIKAIESAKVGQTYFNTYYKKPIFSDGVNWLNADGYPYDSIYKTNLTLLDTDVTNNVVKRLILNDNSKELSTLTVINAYKTVGKLLICPDEYSKTVIEMLVTRFTLYNGEWRNTLNNRIHIYSRYTTYIIDEEYNVELNEWTPWKDYDINSGSSEERPTNYLPAGYNYFDTTLNKPIWWSGSNWVDSTGNDVDQSNE